MLYARGASTRLLGRGQWPRHRDQNKSDSISALTSLSTYYTERAATD